MSNPKTEYLKQGKPIDRQSALDLMMASRMDEYDLALGGYPALSLSGLSGNVDLDLPYAFAATVLLTGNPSAAVTIRIPHKEHATLAGARAEITFVNDCGGSFSTVTIKSTGANSSSPVGVILLSGRSQKVRHNGNSCYPVTSSITFGGGWEIAYAEFTSNVTITATSEASPDDVVSLGVACDGNPVWLEFFAPVVLAPNSQIVIISLWEDSNDRGRLAVYDFASPATNAAGLPCMARRKLTPSAGSHTFKVRASVLSTGSGVIGSGAGGPGLRVPGYLRITPT